TLEHNTFAWFEGLLLRRFETFEVAGGDAGGKLKANALQAVAQTIDGSIHGYHKRSVTCRFCSSYQLQCPLPALLKIQLKPPRPGTGRCNFFESRAGQGTQYEN